MGNETVTVEVSYALAVGLQKALRKYRPGSDEKVLCSKSRAWIDAALSSGVSSVFLTAKPKSLRWLVERVVGPGENGCGAAGKIIAALSSSETREVQGPRIEEGLMRRVRKELADGKYDLFRNQAGD